VRFGLLRTREVIHVARWKRPTLRNGGSQTESFDALRYSQKMVVILGELVHLPIGA